VIANVPCKQAGVGSKGSRSKRDPSSCSAPIPHSTCDQDSQASTKSISKGSDFKSDPVRGSHLKCDPSEHVVARAYWCRNSTKVVSEKPNKTQQKNLTKHDMKSDRAKEFPVSSRARTRARSGRETPANSTKRGVPADYAGTDPDLCNAHTQSGGYCRALGLPGSGRCKHHGGSLAEQALQIAARRAAKLERKAKAMRESAYRFVNRHRRRCGLGPLPVPAPGSGQPILPPADAPPSAKKGNKRQHFPHTRCVGKFGISDAQ